MHGEPLASGSRTIQVVEPGQAYLGQTYQRLAGAWWNWAFKEPEETNVVLDATGADCRRNQQGPVWFLAGTFFGDPVTRTCTIPAGKAIFFPIANGVSFYPEFPEPDNRCTLSGRFDLTTVQGQLGGVRCDVNDDLILSVVDDEIVDRFVPLKVSIDDLSTPRVPDLNVTDLFGYRAQTPPGGYTQKLPDNNVTGLPAGDRFPAVADGYWIFLKPLPAGRYRIKFKTVKRDDNTFVDVTYNLTIAD